MRAGGRRRKEVEGWKGEGAGGRTMKRRRRRARVWNGRMEEEGRTNEEKVGLLPAPAITIVAVVVEGIAINP